MEVIEVMETATVEAMEIMEVMEGATVEAMEGMEIMERATVEAMEGMGIETLYGLENVADGSSKPRNSSASKDVKVILIKSPETPLPPASPWLHDLHVLQGGVWTRCFRTHS